MHSSPIDGGCQCCGGSEFLEIVTFRGVPATGVFRRDPADPCPVSDLTFESCARCSLLRRRDFAQPPEYADRERPTGRQLPAYRDELLEAVAELAGGRGELIVEIGSNDGTFLQLLRERGHTNVVGVEPAVELAEAARRRGLRVEARYFGPDAVPRLLARYGAPRLVVCRHTLEHVPFPRQFVAAIGALLAPAGGRALIEVPDSTAIADQLNFVELWDEHLFYFTPATLRLLLEGSGLAVRDSASLPHLDTRNLLVSAGCAPGTPSPLPVGGTTQDWMAFARRYARLAARLRDEIGAAPRPVHVVGASHPQCNFVNYLELGPVVDFMIDDDAAKSGRFPPLRGSGASIITTGKFVDDAAGGSVVLTGFGYPGWMRRIAEAAARKSMRIIDPRAVGGNAAH
jgi:SAM-dependent methyltransferase